MKASDSVVLMNRAQASQVEQIEDHGKSQAAPRPAEKKERQRLQSDRIQSLLEPLRTRFPRRIQGSQPVTAHAEQGGPPGGAVEKRRGIIERTRESFTVGCFFLKGRRTLLGF
jgi:hypothetical protein